MEQKFWASDTKEKESVEKLLNFSMNFESIRFKELQKGQPSIKSVALETDFDDSESMRIFGGSAASQDMFLKLYSTQLSKNNSNNSADLEQEKRRETEIVKFEDNSSH